MPRSPATRKNVAGDRCFRAKKAAHLQHDGCDDEGQHEVVEAVVLLAHLEHVLELGGVGREEGHVEHALGDGLLGGIAVGVQGLPLEI